MTDRFDAKYLKNIDSMHFIMPFMFPNRCDNETFFSFRLDLSELNAYIAKKNADNPEYRYNLFQCLIAAVLKTITLRSRLSVFIHDRRMYKRNEVTAAFTVKQEFSDDGGELYVLGGTGRIFRLKLSEYEIWNGEETMRENWRRLVNSLAQKKNDYIAGLPAEE